MARVFQSFCAKVVTLRTLLATSILLVAIAIPAQAQNSPAAPFAGTWKGKWVGQTREGPTELVIEARGDQVSGQVQSGNQPPECPDGWRQLAGHVRDGKLVVVYVSPGQCGKVHVIYSINPEANVLTGNWSSDWPSFGTSRLTKQP